MDYLTSKATPAIPYADADDSMVGDWLRLSIMLLLLVVGRAVVPLHQAPKPAGLTTTTSKAETITFFFAGTTR